MVVEESQHTNGLFSSAILIKVGSGSEVHVEDFPGGSTVRSHLPIQEALFDSGSEDPTCRATTKPMHHNH